MLTLNWNQENPSKPIFYSMSGVYILTFNKLRPAFLSLPPDTKYTQVRQGQTKNPDLKFLGNLRFLRYYYKKMDPKKDWKQQEKQNRQGILNFLWEEGFATAEQIKKHVFTQTTDKSLFYRRKLLKMEKAGLISRISIPLGRYYVYYLLGKGWNNIESPQAHKISPTDKDKIWNTSFSHKLKCINARLELENLIQMQDYYSTRTLALYPKPFPRKPDFVFTTNGNPDKTNAPQRIAVEVELTYRNIKKTKQIIAYWAYSLQKAQIDMVLFLSDTNAKKQRLKKIIADQKNQMIPIQLKTVLFGEKTYREEKVLVQQEDINRIRTAKIGETAKEPGLFEPGSSTSFDITS